MDSSHVDTALLVWMLLSIPASGLSFFLTYPNLICVFHLFYCIMNFGGVLVLLLGWQEDLAEASMDWGERSPALTTNWSLIGLAFVFIASLVVGFLLGDFSLTRTQEIAFFWVPHELYPMEMQEVGSVLPFAMNLFGTWFSVVPGEEGLKISCSALSKAYEHADWELPFAFHPARLFGNGAWSAMHIVKGQYPIQFAGSVFASGLVMDSASAQSGTIMTNYFIHALFNTILLIANLILGGFLTIKVV